MLYIFRSAKVGNHDVIHIFKTEDITRKLDTFPVMTGYALDTERTIADTDSFATTENESVFS